MSLSVLVAVFYLYHLAIFLISLGISRPKVGTPRGEGKTRFAVLIPAYNEANVIADSVQSVLACDYPGDRFDVYVIADNCTDETARLARGAGAQVLERWDNVHKGKQHALKWAFEHIHGYDAVVILDADNRVDPGLLRVFDYELKRGGRVLQAYIETQNPSDSWVTANYAYMFWYTCRLQMARMALGLSAWLGGTGVCIAREVLERVGWPVETLTDDVEYTCQLLLAGERVRFVPGAVVYDQKPRTLADSMRQRLRWIRGQTQVTMRYLPCLALTAAHNWWRGDFRQAASCLDGILWVPMHLVIFASVMGALWGSGWRYLLGLAVSVPVYDLLVIVAERVRLRKAWRYLATAGVFFLTWVPVTAMGVVTFEDSSWWRTPHR